MVHAARGLQAGAIVGASPRRVGNIAGVVAPAMFPNYPQRLTKADDPGLTT